MAAACPQCADHTQVLNLPAFWRGLPKEAALRRELAKPPAYDPAWLPVAGLLAVGLIAMADGLWLTGALALLAGAVLGAWVWRAWREAEEARERWERSLYCRRCPAVFPVEDATVVR